MKLFCRVALLALLAVPLAAPAAVPSTLRFTGRMVDGGQPVSGTHNFTFTLFNAATAGTSLWTETKTGLTVTDGIVTAVLGETTAVDPTFLAGGTVYLEISYDGAALAPRIHLAAVPYALLASDSEKLGGRPLTDFTNAGTLNASSNPVDWTKLKSVPASLVTLANGAPAAKTFQTTSSGAFPSTEANLRTFSVTIPAAGQIVFTMSGYLRVTHTNGTNTSVSMWATQGSSRQRVITFYMPSAFPTASPYNQPFSFTTSFTVASAGTHDINLSGVSNEAVDWGDCGAIVQGCPHVTFQYFPATLP